jgi:dihydrofolate reductase
VPNCIDKPSFLGADKIPPPFLIFFLPPSFIISIPDIAFFFILGKPLPNRINVVISRKRELGDHTFDDCGSALDFCAVEYPDKEIFIIGGSAIYEAYLDIIDRFYITEIDADYECDKFFDLTYVKENFTKVIEHAILNDPIKYTIKEYNL